MIAYDNQMKDWLEFAWANKDNPEFKSIQTARFPIGNRKGVVIGAVKLHPQNGRYTTGETVKKSQRAALNNYALFKKWISKNSFSMKNKRYLHYTDAIPEMHIFFDFMEDLS